MKNKKPEILLIVPKYTYTNLTKNANYHYAIPFGLAYISSVLKKAGYPVDVLNLNHLNGSVEDLIKQKLDSKKYDYVCTGHYGLGYEMVEKITKAVRSHRSKPKIILGGPLITSEPELMANALEFDYAVLGEGEITIVELLKYLEKNKNPAKVDGICYKVNGKIFFTKPRELIKNLDSIPFPDFEALGFEEQLNHLSCNDSLYAALDYPRVYPILGSRGCPFNCTFCYHTTGDKYRARSVDNIIKELEFAIKKYKINGFNLLDDLFSANRERLNEFCKRVKELRKLVPGEFKWRCSLWVSTVDKEMLKLMKESGCHCVGLGFESYSPIVLKSMKKPITPEQIDKAIKACKELHMPIEGNFIFGDVAETKETARVTLDYWKKNCEGQVKLFFIHPYPGSEIYKHSIRKGIIKDRLDFIKNKIHHTNIINMTDAMTDREFEQLKKEVYDLKRKYEKYVVPIKIKKLPNDKCEIFVRCPFCGKISNFKNCFIRNKRYFGIYTACRNKDCQMRFNIVSPLYKFTTNHYLELDFLRKNYLLIRDSILRKRL